VRGCLENFQDLQTADSMSENLDSIVQPHAVKIQTSTADLQVERLLLKVKTERASQNHDKL
jgi:hypothetical protein